MSNFHFTKVIAGVGPILAKETVLSKIVNMVDVFRINLSQGFDDNNKKYVDTILKLDNSKSIMLETKGTDLRVKNVININLKKGDKIEIEYSEYAQESDKKIYIDYPKLHELPKGTIIIFEQSNIQIKVSPGENENLNGEVVQGGEILQYDRIIFQDYVVERPFLTDKDKKDILWGLEYGTHMLAASAVRNKDDIFMLKDFLEQHHAAKMKVFAKIETKEAVENLQDLIQSADGIILVYDKIEKYCKQQKITQEDIIQLCKKAGRPIIITYINKLTTKEYPFFDNKIIKKYVQQAVDGIMIETMIQEEETLDIVTKVHTLIDDNKQEIVDDNLVTSEEKFYQEDEALVKDYIIYNAYRITKELPIKAIVSYTDNGYTAAKLASLNPNVPVIAFTKSDESYRYLNAIWGVKGYKISQSFNYENLKRIGKEMIRIIFKGNISLDDKIIIIQANERQTDEKSDMINGVELYKFKNI